jgi:ABC-type glycerol-3-phosphate transport system permease component
LFSLMVASMVFPFHVLNIPLVSLYGVTLCLLNDRAIVGVTQVYIGKKAEVAA